MLDIGSGSVHVVDGLAYDVIALYENSPAEDIVSAMKEKYPDEPESEIRECISEVEELKKCGKLFSDDRFEAATSGFKTKNNEVKALCLHVSHSCNLNCAYCFAGQGRYKGETAMMSLETGKRALEFLIENSGRRTNLEVDFFGGEPLMNLEVVKALVAYARSREKDTGKLFRFTLTTNGVLLDDEAIEFANREMNNVVLSLDGRKEVNDRFRKNFAGEGSYDLILPKFKKFVEARGDKEYYLRGTFTHFNTDFTRDILHMADLGFEKLSMEPVVCAPGDPFALTEEDMPVIKEQYEILAEEMLKRQREGRGFTFYHYMIDLKHGPCIYKRIAGCGSGTEYLAVTPWGELFPCHQFVGDEKYSMGNVWEGVTNIALRDKFSRCSVYSRSKCRECWARLYCSGGCAANAYHAAGDIAETYDYGCELFKKRIECAIMLKAAEESC